MADDILTKMYREIEEAANRASNSVKKLVDQTKGLRAGAGGAFGFGMAALNIADPLANFGKNVAGGKDPAKSFKEMQVETAKLRVEMMAMGQAVESSGSLVAKGMGRVGGAIEKFGKEFKTAANFGEEFMQVSTKLAASSNILAKSLGGVANVLGGVFGNAGTTLAITYTAYEQVVKKSIALSDELIKKQNEVAASFKAAAPQLKDQSSIGQIAKQQTGVTSAAQALYLGGVPGGRAAGLEGLSMGAARGMSIDSSSQLTLLAAQMAQAQGKALEPVLREIFGKATMSFMGKSEQERKDMLTRERLMVGADRLVGGPSMRDIGRESFTRMGSELGRVRDIFGNTGRALSQMYAGERYQYSESPFTDMVTRPYRIGKDRLGELGARSALLGPFGGSWSWLQSIVRPSTVGQQAPETMVPRAPLTEPTNLSRFTNFMKQINMPAGTPANIDTKIAQAIGELPGRAVRSGAEVLNTGQGLLGSFMQYLSKWSGSKAQFDIGSRLKASSEATSAGMETADLEKKLAETEKGLSGNELRKNYREMVDKANKAKENREKELGKLKDLRVKLKFTADLSPEEREKTLKEAEEVRNNIAKEDKTIADFYEAYNGSEQTLATKAFTKTEERSEINLRDALRAEIEKRKIDEELGKSGQILGPSKYKLNLAIGADLGTMSAEYGVRSMQYAEHTEEYEKLKQKKESSGRLDKKDEDRFNELKGKMDAFMTEWAGALDQGKLEEFQKESEKLEKMRDDGSYSPQAIAKQERIVNKLQAYLATPAQDIKRKQEAEMARVAEQFKNRSLGVDIQSMGSQAERLKMFGASGADLEKVQTETGKFDIGAINAAFAAKDVNKLHSLFGGRVGKDKIKELVEKGDFATLLRAGINVTPGQMLDLQGKLNLAGQQLQQRTFDLENKMIPITQRGARESLNVGIGTAATLGQISGAQAGYLQKITGKMEEPEFQKAQPIIQNILSTREKMYQTELQFTVKYTEARMNIIKNHYDKSMEMERLKLEGGDRRFAPQLSYAQGMMGAFGPGNQAFQNRYGIIQGMRGDARSARGLQENRMDMMYGFAGVEVPEAVRMARAMRGQRESEEDFAREKAQEKATDIRGLGQYTKIFENLAAKGMSYKDMSGTEGGRNLIQQLLLQNQGAFARQMGVDVTGMIQNIGEKQFEHEGNKATIELSERKKFGQMYKEQIGQLEEGVAGAPNEQMQREARIALGGKYKEAADFYAKTGQTKEYEQAMDKYIETQKQIPDLLKAIKDAGMQAMVSELKTHTALLQVIAGVSKGGKEEGKGTGTGTSGGRESPKPTWNSGSGGDVSTSPINHKALVASWIGEQDKAKEPTGGLSPEENFAKEQVAKWIEEQDATGETELETEDTETSVNRTREREERMAKTAKESSDFYGDIYAKPKVEVTEEEKADPEVKSPFMSLDEIDSNANARRLARELEEARAKGPSKPLLSSEVPVTESEKPRFFKDWETTKRSQDESVKRLEEKGREWDKSEPNDRFNKLVENLSNAKMTITVKQDQNESKYQTNFGKM